MGLFGEIFSKIMGGDRSSQENIDFENQVRRDGYQIAAKKLAKIINKEINSEDLAREFVLEELDAARQGFEFAQDFVKNSGFKSFEYMGAINRTRWEGDESQLEHLQHLFRSYLMQIRDIDLMVKTSITAVDEIMKEWGLGKYENSNTSGSTNLENKLNSVILPTGIAQHIYAKIPWIKIDIDESLLSPSKTYSMYLQKFVPIALDSTTRIIECLNKKNIDEFHALDILVAFYLIVGAEMTFKDPKKFSDVEITNTINIFLSILETQEQVNISSSYNNKIRIFINYLLLNHPQ